ncbi:WD40/YVTN/BNR-like repeat-containing protein [candidate division KSB1 bacterium]
MYRSIRTIGGSLIQKARGGALGGTNIETRQRRNVSRPSQRTIINYYEMFPDEPQPDPQAQAMGQRGGGGRGGGSRFRFNWNSPILLSPHNSSTVYFGGNHLFKSVDQGATWKIVSPDLSTNDPIKTDRNTGGITRDATGAENHCSIVTVSESHIKQGILWAGTDDSQVHVTTDDGVTWTNVRGNIRGVPDEIWVGRIEAGHFSEGTAYVVFDGHRSDNFEPWVFKTADLGKTWTKITGGIGANEVARVIREDLRNENLLYLGTESGLFVSLNGGQRWERFMNNLPTVPVYDIVIHPRENDLVIGTHGLGIWICDDISPLQQMTAEVMASDVHLMDPKTVTQWTNISRGGDRGSKYFRGENPGGGGGRGGRGGGGRGGGGSAGGPRISFYTGSNINTATLVISDVSGRSKHTVELDTESGLNHYNWNMSFDPPVLTAEEEALLQQYGETTDRQQRTDIQEKLRTSLENRGEMFTGISGRGGFAGMGGQRAGGQRAGRQQPVAGGTPQLSGARAGLGIYSVKLIAGGKTMYSTLEIRQDPLLNR